MSYSTQAALRIALLYGVVAGCWILFTDQLFSPIFAEAPLGIPSRWWQSIKGLFFVTVTSVLLYALVYRQIRRLSHVVDRYRETEHRWQRLLNQTPEPVLILDEGRVHYLNHAAAKILCAETRDEVVGRTLDTLLIDGADEIVSAAPSTRDEAALHTCEIEDSEGQVRELEIRQSIISFDGRECLLSVWRDVTKQREYERGLVAAKNEAENASRMKSTILANLSHEIRTPLTAILGFSDVVPDGPNPPFRESMDLIHRSGQRLKDTLESILTLAEIESGDMAYEPETMDLLDVVTSTAEIFSGQARRKGISFDITTADGPIRAVADPTAVSQIVMNLVSNAVKFTDEGGVTIDVRNGPDHAAVVVSDTGIGIDDKYLAHIFDEFIQVSDGLDREYEGAGIGLTIVRQLVEMQAGSIDVESGLGRGTRFIVRLPTTG